MKRIILSLAIMLISIFTFSSCITAAYADDDAYGYSYDYNVIITNGTPFIVKGLIAYYLYNNMYYYPYYRNGIYHFYRYDRPQPYDRMPSFYKPMPPREKPHMYNNRGFNFNRQQRSSQNNRSFGNMTQRSRMNIQPNNNSRTFGNSSFNRGNRSNINNNGRFGGRR
jgi:hypothetical protein